MKNTCHRHAFPRASFFACALAALTLHGCSSDDLRNLICTGTDTGYSVIGGVRTDRKDPGQLPFEAEQLNSGIAGIFQDPVFRVTVNGFEFEPAHIIVTKESITGQKGKDGVRDSQASFSFDRRNRTLKYQLSSDSTDSVSGQARSDTLAFEGTCKKND